MSGYLDNESLILYHKKSGRVYGFESESAALLLQIDELLKENSVDEIYSKIPTVPKAILTSFSKFLLCNEELGKEVYEPPLNIGIYKDDEKKREKFSTVPLTFFIEFPKESLKRKIYPLVEHLSRHSRTDKAINIDFIKMSEGNYWQILFNGERIAAPVREESLPLLLQENMIIAYYQSKPYLMAMHAGAVKYGRHSLVFPALSGSGKTTLTAALVSEGFDLYSDEIALLGYDGKLKPIPFCMNIKEGSWSVLNERFPKLEKQQAFLRFDGQKVKFLPPENLAKENDTVSMVIFPKYEKNSECKLERLSSCETLKRIKDAGYQLEKPLSEENFESILSHLLSRPAYSLSYGSLEEAVGRIKDLCSG
ncbi:phosphoenolpyruvate carboxykinase (ATP) [Hydrogenimonas cancrithermarum]|uniref:HPr kinase n=1 Tax=Hydrogenimonas cancrithermarum TaxID=2993563 RepID=A0ABN6WU59_9BACT|nr:hypothetical protein [Hydrogenimonas cancrithermarum]BDY12403.1 hypothetical protein HCR_07150 [Hydrogenimonas cancrithermarum]